MLVLIFARFPVTHYVMAETGKLFYKPFYTRYALNRKYSFTGSEANVD